MRNDVRARLIQVIEVEHLRQGEREKNIPSRWVKTYWDLKGNLLSESDPYLQQSLQNATHTTEVFGREEIMGH